MKYGRPGSLPACAGLLLGWTSTGLSAVVSAAAAGSGALIVAAAAALFAALALTVVLPVVAKLVSVAVSCARATDIPTPAENASAHNATEIRRFVLLSGLYTMVPLLHS